MRWTFRRIVDGRAAQQRVARRDVSEREFSSYGLVVRAINSKVCFQQA